MTIPYIPAVDPSIGQNLASIGESVGRLLRPNLEFERALKNALATNPALIQQLGNLAQRSPAAMGQLYGPNVTSYFQGIGQSPEDLASQNRATLDANITGDQTTALANVTPERRQQLATAAVETGLAGGQRPSQVVDEARTQTGQSAFQRYLSANPNFNPNQFISELRKPNGTIDSETGGAALRDPVHGPLLRQLWEQEMQKESEQRNRSYQTQRDIINFNQAQEANRDQLAERFQFQTATGSRASWRRMLDGGITPELVQAINAKPEAQRTREETENLKTYQAYEQYRRTNAAEAIKPFTNSIRGSLTALRAIESNRNLEDSDRSTQYEGIGTSLNNDLAAIGSNLRVRVTPFVNVSWGRDQQPKFEFYDMQNPSRKVTDAEIELGLNQTGGQTQAQTGSNDDPLVTAAVQLIRSGGATAADVESATQYTPAQKAAIRAALAASTRR